MANYYLKKIGQIILALIVFLAVFLLREDKIISTDSGRIIFQTQSFYGDIKVIEFGPYKCLYVNGAGQSCVDENKESDSRYIQELAEIISQASPKSVLLMGMGGGTVLSVLPKSAKIDVVEIDPEIVKVAEDYDLVPERDYEIFYDDARRFAKTTDKKYDLVIMDLALGDTLPFYMLTKESFEAIKKITKENGTVFIHLSLSPKEKQDSFFISVVKTLNQIFDGIEVISTNPNELLGVNFLISREKIKFNNFYKLTGFDLQKAKIITDNYNPLEGYFLPHLLDFRGGEKTLGEEIYLID